MDQPAATVRVTVPFVSGDSRAQTLEGELVFDPQDPFAVAMRLDGRLGPVTWTFARELLANGVYEPSGDGDVQVWPCLSNTGAAVVIIELCSPGGPVLLQVPTRAVHDFVQSTYAHVPEGAESAHLSLDKLVSQLLGS